MDIERSLQDNFYLNILCYSMGKTNEAFFDKIVTLLNKYASRLYFSPIYQNELRDKGRSTVPGKDWNTGLIRCRYLVKNPSVDWAECQIYYKCHAAIVILDMNTCDVQKITEDIMKVKKMMATDQITPYRIFAFNCVQEHTLYFAEEKLSLLVSAVSRDEDLIPILQSGVEVLLYTTAIHFFMEMVRLKLDNHTIPLFNTKEEGLKDASKVKKRKQGRSLKLCGDLALMLGCYKDASGYYAQGYDIVKSNDDYLWMGKTKEAQASCIYLEHLFTEKEEQSGDKVALTRVIEAIIKKMEGASNYFRKSKTAKGLEFDKECFFKLLKVLKDLGAKNNFNDFVKFYVETAKNNSAPEDHYRIMLKISGFFYEMQMFKKAGFFLKQVADAIIQDNFNPDLARDLYLACFPLYNIPLSREILPDNFPKTEFLKIIENNKQISQEIKRIAPVIQLQLINDVLALVTNDIPLQTKIISIILHYFLEDINNFTQQKLFNHLVTLGNTLNKNLKLDLTFLPEVVKLIPSPEVLKVNIKHYEGGVDKGNVFIYNPWKKGGTNVSDYNWMVGNVCYIKVFLRNVFEFEVFVDMIMLVTEGVKTTNYPTSVILRKTKTLQELTLKFKPLETGTMNLLGIVSKLSNFVHFHPINAKGVAIKNYSERTTPKDNIGIRKIPIKEKVSTLKVFFEETAEEIKLYEGGQFCTRVMIENKNESTVCLRKLQVSFAFNDNTTLDKEINVTDKEIQRYEQLPLIIWRAAVDDAKLAQGDLDIQPHILLNVFDVPNVDRMFKIYIKIIYYDKDKPNMSVEDNITKEVKMVKSLSVCAVQVADSLAMNQVTISGKTYNHVSTDDGFYLSVEVIRDDPEANKNDYIISVYLKGVEKPLKEQIMLGSLNTSKLTARLDKESLLLAGGEAGWKDVNKLLYGKWRDMNSIDIGYLLFTNLNIAPLVEKVESSKVKFAVETSSSQVTNGQYEPAVGDLETFKIKVNILDNTKKKLYVSVVFSEEINIENAMSSKREKGVVYKGKKSFLVEFEEGKPEALLEIRAMFMETRFYNLFCFAVDDEHGIAYSYKYPFHIKPK